MKSKELLLNNHVSTWDQKVNVNDVITYKQKQHSYKAFHLDIEVLYEDSYLAVINKPAGYAVSGNTFKTIQNALLGNLTLSNEKDALSVPRPVHRLDLQTSGLLIISKTLAVSKEIGHQFETRSVSKSYKCVVKGAFPEQHTCEEAIDDLQADTQFENEQTLENRFLGELSLVNAYPNTGRKHQIRKHLKSLGYPILGDKVYGEYFSKGLFLQASSVSFTHPVSGKQMKFELELPKKFLNLLNHKK